MHTTTKVAVGILGGLVAANVGVKAVAATGGTAAGAIYMTAGTLLRPLQVAFVPFWAE